MSQAEMQRWPNGGPVKAHERLNGSNGATHSRGCCCSCEPIRVRHDYADVRELRMAMQHKRQVGQSPLSYAPSKTTCLTLHKANAPNHRACLYSLTGTLANAQHPSHGSWICSRYGGDANFRTAQVHLQAMRQHT